MTTAFLVMYFVLNVAVALLLDRKRFRVALVCHLVMFAFMSFFVLVCSGADFLSDALTRVLGEDGFNILLSALVFGDTELLLPIVIVQVLLTLQIALLAFACTCEVVCQLQIRKRKPRTDSNNGNAFSHEVRTNTTRPSSRKLCYLLQSLLC